MKNYRIIIAVAVAVILFIGLWPLRRPNPQTTGTTLLRADATNGSTHAPQTTVGAGAGAQGRTTVMLTNLPLEKQAEIIRQGKEQAEAHYAVRSTAWLNQQNSKINFWGKVVDQDDKPLEGVEILMDVRQWSLVVGPSAKFREFLTKTDAQGCFEWTDAHGDSLGVKSIIKAGYTLSPEDKRRAISFGYHGYAKPFVPDRNNPVIIKMWKAKGADPMIYYDQGGGKVAVDGTPVQFDLLRGRMVEQGGQLEVRYFREPREIVLLPNTKYAWQLVISAPGGGVQWRDDTFGYEAPVDNYQERLELDFAADAKWQRHYNGEFYFRTREGYYGRLRFQLNTETQPPPCPFYIVECYLNPSGSRNLEYNPSLRIRPDPHAADPRK